MDTTSLLRSCRTWSLWFLLGAGMLLVALVLAVGAEYVNAERKLRYGLSTWESDLAVAILNSDWLGVRRVGSHLYFSELDQLTVVAEDFPVYAFPTRFESPGACQTALSLPIRRYGVEIGHVDACLSIHRLVRIVAGNIPVLCGSLLLAAMFSLAAVLPLEHYRRRLHRVVRALKDWSEKDKHTAAMPFGDANDATQCALIELVDRGVRREITMERELAQTRSAQQLATLSAQVAHDIRSPLAALNMALPDLQQCPEETRILVRSAIARVQDIANLLLSESHGSSRRDSDGPKSGEDRLQLLVQVADSTITEARTRWRQRLDITIESSWDVGAYGLFCDIDPGELKTVLANLLNNAVEAQPSGGSVQLLLEQRHSNKACIEIADAGGGMPPEALASLGQRGATFQKPGGNGLGLHHAFQTCERWGGSIEVESTPRDGTRIRLLLPTTAAPDWFVSAIDVRESSVVVVVDDDASIHHIWDDRLIKMQVRPSSIVHLSSPAELTKWAHSDRRVETATYLVDYEYIGSAENGLSLIERHCLAEQSILVTSRFDEDTVRKTCSALGVRLLPKAAVAYVPILSAHTAPSLFDAVLIDDDPLMRRAWEHSAARAGITLKSYPSCEQFVLSAANLSRKTPVYVDYCLRGQSGSDVSKKIHSMGFTHIVIATGLSRNDVGHLPWIREVIGKTPPFRQLEFPR